MNRSVYFPQCGGSFTLSDDGYATCATSGAGLSKAVSDLIQSTIPADAPPAANAKVEPNRWRCPNCSGVLDSWAEPAMFVCSSCKIQIPARLHGLMQKSSHV